jgi:TonB family protein
MLSPTALTQGFLNSLLLILLAQALPQSTTQQVSKLPRIHLKQEQLCCFSMHFVKPIYPREARLAGIEGIVKLVLVIAADGSVTDLQDVSGDPLLLDSTLKAVRQWHISVDMGGVGGPRETEVPFSFTFKIEDPPEPAYLHLSNGRVIRANNIREFTDRIEYTVGGRTHHISPDSVTDISACARASISIPPKEGDCVPSGGPSFDIRAIPLLPAVKTSHTGRPVLHSLVYRISDGNASSPTTN